LSTFGKLDTESLDARIQCKEADLTRKKTKMMQENIDLSLGERAQRGQHPDTERGGEENAEN
jgi:hypothetical protein